MMDKALLAKAGQIVNGIPPTVPYDRDTWLDYVIDDLLGSGVIRWTFAELGAIKAELQALREYAPQGFDPRAANKLKARHNLGELRRVVVKLWTSACDCSTQHQGILATLESGVLQACDGGSVTQSQVLCFYSALNKLRWPQISREDAEDESNEFRRHGIGQAFAFLDGGRRGR